MSANSKPTILFLTLTLTALTMAACNARNPEATSPSTALQAPPAPEHQELEQALQEELDALREAFGFPGATAAVSLPGGTVAAAATGFADVELGEVMSPESRMPAASIGKTFVSATALALAHRGQLDLDDKLSKWLADEPWFTSLPNASVITLRHLLSHSAGLVDHVYENAFREAMARLRYGPDANPDEYIKPRELIGMVLDREPLFAPGEGYSYTDTGYIIMGLVIEKASGETFYGLAQDLFFEPFGLTRTTPAVSRQIDGLAAGYEHPENTFQTAVKVAERGVLSFNPSVEWTGGGFVSNPQDLVRWARAIYSGRALAEPYLEDLIESGFRGGDTDYGLGVFVNEGAPGPRWGHGGIYPGFRSSMRYYPDVDLAVALQVNHGAANDIALWTDRLAGRLATLLEGSDSVNEGNAR